MPLVMVMMALTLVTGLATVLVIGTMAETAIVASYREAAETFYAAEAAVEFTMHELAAATDWDDISRGSTTSSFVDGPPDGIRTVGAATIDLTAATADVNALAAAASPSGSSPLRLYAYGRFADLAPAAGVPPLMYVAVWIGDLPDGALRMIGRAYGPRGSRRSVAVAVARAEGEGEAGPAAVEVILWHELR